MSNNIVSATITTNFPSPQENKLKNTLILHSIASHPIPSHPEIAFKVLKVPKVLIKNTRRSPFHIQHSTFHIRHYLQHSTFKIRHYKKGPGRCVKIGAAPFLNLL